MGATEIFCEGTRRCIDLFSGKPLGFFGCNHVADSQGADKTLSSVIYLFYYMTMRSTVASVVRFSFGDW